MQHTSSLVPAAPAHGRTDHLSSILQGFGASYKWKSVSDRTCICMSVVYEGQHAHDALTVTFLETRMLALLMLQHTSGIISTTYWQQQLLEMPVMPVEVRNGLLQEACVLCAASIQQGSCRGTSIFHRRGACPEMPQWPPQTLPVQLSSISFQFATPLALEKLSSRSRSSSTP